MKTEMNFLLTVGILLAVAAVLIAYPYNPDVEIPILKPVTFQEMPRFESYEALKAAFEEGGRSYGYGVMDMITSISTAVPMAMGASKAMAESGAGGGSDDFSTTNIQVEGVDEADIVKTDGKYIYALSGNSLVIVDAYPIQGAEITSKTSFSEISPIEMFVEGDRLLIFGNVYRQYYDEVKPLEEKVAPGLASDMIAEPYYRGSSRVIARIYDISNRGDPQLEKEIEFEGSYQTSRLIGKNAYFVVNSYPQYWAKEEEINIIPLMVEDGIEKRIAEPTEIAYLPPMPAQSFVTIVSLNLETGEMQKETIAGSAQNVFASQGSIYLASTVWLPRDTIIPEGTPIVKDLERIIIGDTEKTVVNKFGLDKGTIGYVGQGEVPGHVLNQFSMDEYKGNFRIATTAGQVSRMGSQSTNNLYVLDEKMNLIGSLEDLAPGEKIYSARFMGEKAYMVTFKKVDPLFVIDVSDPTNPRVLGKLKIPGYSDYLHPIDEDHLIGIGKDTIESKTGDFAWYQGLKMAVFDVSDVENPIEMHKIIIGDRGTDSYALHDHKAFLYDKEKELLVLPIMLAEIPEENKKPLEENQPWPGRGEPTFQGAFVYRLTLENGFEEKGRITHVSDEQELKRGYYYGDSYSVKRALYIGNVLYTLSESMLKANALDTLEALKEFSFN